MIQVQKRDGTREPLDINKFHKVAMHACEGMSGVSVSDLEIKTHIQFYNGIKSTDIQETLIKAAADLIDEDHPNYQYVAGRLINYNLRKEVYGEYEPADLQKSWQSLAEGPLQKRSFQHSLVRHRGFGARPVSVFAEEVCPLMPTFSC